MSRCKNTGSDISLGYRLKQTQHILRLRMDDALRYLNLTTPQYAVLSQLELRGGISNAELARVSFITPQTMHAIVSHLERRNLLRRTSDLQHGRILRTELTTEGLELVQEAHKIIKKVEDTMTCTMADKDKMLLEKLLAECFDNLNVDL